MPSPTDEKLSLPMKKYWREEYFVCLCYCGSYCRGCGGVPFKDRNGFSTGKFYTSENLQAERADAAVLQGYGHFHM